MRLVSAKKLYAAGVRIYVNPDKNPRTLKAEGAMLRMHRILLDSGHSYEDLRMWYESFEISKSGVDIVKIEPGAARETEVSFLWNLKGLADNSIKREELLASFSAGSSTRTRGATMWSV